MASNVWTVPHAGKWANKREGSSRVSRIYDSKAEAVAAGKAMATRDRVEHVIAKLDGSVGERNSYGGDPRRFKG